MSASSVFWHSLLPEGTPVCLPTQSLPQSTDVLVIGLGLAGSACAFKAAALGLKVVAVDARGLAGGATGRNGGHLWRELQMSRKGEAGYAEVSVEQHNETVLKELLRSPGLTEDVQFFETGGAHIVFSEERVAYLAHDGQCVVDSGEDKHLSEFLRGKLAQDATGQASAHAALFNSSAGQLVPAKLVEVLAQKAREHGATLLTETRVQDIVEAGDGLWDVNTSRGSIRAKHVVHATNGMGVDLLPPGTPIVPVRGQCVAAAAASPLSPGGSMLFFSCEDSLEEYLIQRVPDNSVVFGGMRHLAPQSEGIINDSVIDEEVSEGLRRELSSLFGQRAEVTHEWTGIMGFTPDHNPIVGPLLSRPGQYIVAGFSGHGMPRAMVCGFHIAELIADVPPTCPAIDVFSPERGALADASKQSRAVEVEGLVQ